MGLLFLERTTFAESRLGAISVKFTHEWRFESREEKILRLGVDGGLRYGQGRVGAVSCLA